jgi:hypothetical protein
MRLRAYDTADLCTGDRRDALLPPRTLSLPVVWISLLSESLLSNACNGICTTKKDVPLVNSSRLMSSVATNVPCTENAAFTLVE